MNENEEDKFVCIVVRYHLGSDPCGLPICVEEEFIHALGPDLPLKPIQSHASIAIGAFEHSMHASPMAGVLSTGRYCNTYACCPAVTVSLNDTRSPRCTLQDLDDLIVSVQRESRTQDHATHASSSHRWFDAVRKWIMKRIHPFD